MHRLDPTPDTWRAWRAHLTSHATALALAARRATGATGGAAATGTPAAGTPDAASLWHGPALSPVGLRRGRFAELAAGASPVQPGTLRVDEAGLHWAPASDAGATSLPWDEVASAEVVRAWWRSRAGVRVRCAGGDELWFDAPDAEGLEKALDAVSAA